RFGDPETQPILFRLKTDLLQLLDAALEGKLAKAKAEWDPRPAVGVVMAAAGYPGDYRKGDEITGLPTAPSATSKVFHAGTGRNERDQVVTRGGRVLCVVGTGDTVKTAQAEAYKVVREIHFDGALWRTDIGYRAIDRGL
ncbi:MAG: phosphoribosylglycinamide synthetase C domain-containing protein, partial [Gammaproteobacteria bacterium]